MDSHGTWAKGYWDRGTHVIQQKLGQMSSRGHLRSLTTNCQDMHNWSLYPHTLSLMDFDGTWTNEY